MSAPIDPEPVRSAIRKTAVFRLLAGAVMLCLGVLMLVYPFESSRGLMRFHGGFFCLIALGLLRSALRLWSPDETRIVKTLVGDPEQIGWVHTQRAPLITALGGEMIVVRFRDGDWITFQARKAESEKVLANFNAALPGVVRPFSPDEMRAHAERVRAWKSSHGG